MDNRIGLNTQSKRVVFTGGHHTPAIAVISALRGKFEVQSSKFKVFWLGHKYSMWGAVEPSVEYRTVTGLGIPFYKLKAGKVYRTFNPLMWLRIPFGFFQAFWYLLKIRPHLIVSFGGYLAVPVVVAGWLLGIPSVTHEQTVVSGWANRVIAKFAKRIFITWPESEKYFPREKVVLTGLPLRKEIFEVAKLRDCDPPIGEAGITKELPTIYITGGKQGSKVINQAVEEALPELRKYFNVIHQVGSSQLPVVSSQSGGAYLAKDYFGEDEIGAVYAAADFVVSRAGANTVYELTALGKPAILIPIPWVSHNEQEENAKVLVRAGSAEILPQNQLSAATLINQCILTSENLEKYREGGEKAKKLVRSDAAEKMLGEVLNFLVSS